MHIGIASPISIQNIEHYLKIKSGSLPECICGTNATIIIFSLLQAGHRVSVYTLSKYIKFFSTFKFDNLTLHIGHYRPEHRAWDLFKKEISNVKYMIRNDPPEIVHANWSYEFAMGSLKANFPTLVTIRDWAPVILRFFPDHYRFARLLLNNKVLKKAKCFSTNSPYLKILAENRIKRNISLIPNPVDNGIFYHGTKYFENDIRNKIISVNNGFSSRKNVGCLLRAFSVVKNTLSNIELLLVGEGFEDNGEAKKWAIKNNVDISNVNFCGIVNSNKLCDLYDKSHLLVHPSLEESFGNTLVEAMARKVPVIAGKNSGAVPWVLDYGKAGILVDVKDHNAIAQAIIKVLTDNQMWQSLSQSGFENAYKRFRASEIIKLYIDEYKKTIDHYRQF